MPFVCFAQPVTGIAPLVSEVALAPATITVGTIAWILAIFILIPASLIGGILRLIGYRFDPQSKGWKLDLKQAIGKLLKYFFYHLLLLFGWTTFVANAGFYSDELRQLSFFQLLFIIIDNKWFAFAVYTFIFAVAGTYLMYFYNLLIKKQTFKPTIFQILRLFIWNIVFFLILGGIILFAVKVLM